MKRSFSTLAGLLIGTVLVTAQGQPAQALSWTQWRGPQRAALVEDELPAPEKLTEVWRIEVGEGQSSPVVGPSTEDDPTLIFLHSRQHGQETVQAIDPEKGTSVWRQAFDETYEPYPGAKSFGKGPKSTPALDDGKLCTLSVRGTLSCFEARSGEVLWRKSFGERFPEPYPPFGTAMSPLFDEDRLIVHVGGHPAGALLALDPATGKPLWSYEGEGPGYSSPITAVLEGTRQVVTQAHRNIISVEAQTGRLLWSYPLVTPCDQNIVTPALYGDLLVFSSLESGIFALRPRRTADGWRVEKAWHNEDHSLYMSSPVVVGERLVGLSRRGKGQFFALEVTTGKELWTSAGRQGEHAALIASEDRFLAVKSSAEAVLFKPEGNTFREAAGARIASSQVWSHPVPAAEGWLVRDGSTLRLLREE